MNKSEQDFVGEFAEERALIHAADILMKTANESIRKKINPTMKKYLKNKDVEAMDALAHSIPDCIERFYAVQLVNQVKHDIAKKAKK